jgi:hypothetical protein
MCYEYALRDIKIEGRSLRIHISKFCTGLSLTTVYDCWITVWGKSSLSESVKVKLSSALLIKHYDMKAYWGVDL